MEAIESIAKPLEFEEENLINIKTGLTSPTVRSNFKQQFYMYLKAFTDGQAHRNVSAGGAAKVYEAYRQLCEIGRSRRPEHVLELRNRVNSPAAAKSLQTLAATITAWEAERLYLQKIRPTDPQLLPEDLKLVLINLCPEDLKKHSKRDISKWPEYPMCYWKSTIILRG